MIRRGFLLCLILIVLAVPGFACESNTPVSVSVVDSDGDGWSDTQERDAGTDIRNKDTDGDGYWDPKDPNPLDSNIPDQEPMVITVPEPAPTSESTPEPTTTTTMEQNPEPMITIGPYENILWIGYSLEKERAFGTLSKAGYNIGTFSETVYNKKEIDQELLSKYGIIILAFSHNEKRYTESEIELLSQWFENGGSLLFIDWLRSDQCNIDPLLLKNYDIVFNRDHVSDPNHEIRPTVLTYRLYKTSEITQHPITSDVNSMVYLAKLMTRDPDYCSSLKIVGDRSRIIITGTEDAYSEFYTHRPPLLAVSGISKKRAVFIGGASILQNLFTDSFIVFEDNQALLKNIINWLAYKK